MFGMVFAVVKLNRESFGSCQPRRPARTRLTLTGVVIIAVAFNAFPKRSRKEIPNNINMADMDESWTGFSIPDLWAPSKYSVKEEDISAFLFPLPKFEGECLSRSGRNYGQLLRINSFESGSRYC